MARFIHSDANSKGISQGKFAGQLPPHEWLPKTLSDTPCPNSGEDWGGGRKRPGISGWIFWAIQMCRIAGLSLPESEQQILPRLRCRDPKRLDQIRFAYNCCSVPLGAGVPGGKRLAASNPLPPPEKVDDRPLPISRQSCIPPTTDYRREKPAKPEEQVRRALAALDATVRLQNDVRCLIAVRNRRRGYAEKRYLADWATDPSCITEGSDEGVWWIPNFCRNTPTSRRDDITYQRYLCCESDDQNTSVIAQARLMARSGLPFITICSSAGKSAHGVCDLGECSDTSDFIAKGERVYQTLEDLGLKMDWKCRFPERLTRMPGGFRRAKSKTQTLFWTGQGGQIKW